jgi:hypothetical protein
MFSVPTLSLHLTGRPIIIWFHSLGFGVATNPLFLSPAPVKKIFLPPFHSG